MRVDTSLLLAKFALPPSLPVDHPHALARSYVFAVSKRKAVNIVFPMPREHSDQILCQLSASLERWVYHPLGVPTVGNLERCAYHPLGGRRLGAVGCQREGKNVFNLTETYEQRAVDFSPSV